MQKGCFLQSGEVFEPSVQSVDYVLCIFNRFITIPPPWGGICESVGNGFHSHLATEKTAFNTVANIFGF
ncbi:MAG: hypothetical protein GX416_04395 [Bacteroidales bacterium]|nr:hypothetical protein [Bacteroidales bacterium]